MTVCVRGVCDVTRQPALPPAAPAPGPSRAPRAVLDYFGVLYVGAHLRASSGPVQVSAQRSRGSALQQSRLGPALGEQDLRIPDDKSQTAGFTQLWTWPSVRCVPQVHGWMTLVERHPTINLRAEKSNVAETELGNTMALRS